MFDRFSGVKGTVRLPFIFQYEANVYGNLGNW